MQTYKSLILGFFLSLVATGCSEEFPTYSSYCDQNSSFQLPCLRYPLVEPEEKARLEEHFELKEDLNCPYYLKLTKYKIGTCSNSVVKSTGSDFDGYIRIEILKGFTCYYKVQSDFKSDKTAAYNRVLERSKKEIKIKK